MFEGVLLDAAGTILDLRPSLALRLSKELEGSGVASSDLAIEKLLSKSDLWPADVADPSERRRGWNSFFESILDALLHEAQVDLPTRKLRSSADQISRALVDPAQYALYPDAERLLRDLRRERVPVCIVSNFDVLLQDILEGLNVMSLVDAAVISGACGVRKPDPEIFHLAARRLGAPIDRLVHFGDSPRADIVGAIRAGASAVLVDRAALHPDCRRSISELDHGLSIVLGRTTAPACACGTCREIGELAVASS